MISYRVDSFKRKHFACIPCLCFYHEEELIKDTLYSEDIKYLPHVFILKRFDAKNKQRSLRIAITRNTGSRIYYNNELENTMIKNNCGEIDNSHYRLILKLDKEMQINHDS
jgi:hypothetical protein